MVRFPEVMQFRVLSGTGEKVEQIARAEGKRPAQILREAVEQRLALSLRREQPKTTEAA